MKKLNDESDVNNRAKKVFGGTGRQTRYRLHKN